MRSLVTLCFICLSANLAHAELRFLTALYTTESGSTFAASGDFHSDGKLDLLVLNQTGQGATSTVSLLRGNGNGTFQPATKLIVDGMALGIVAGDFNSDGKLDFALAINNRNLVVLYLGNGDGTFQAPLNFNSGGLNPLSLIAADFNGDGNLDLAVTNDAISGEKRPSGVVSIFLGNGQGNFTKPLRYAVSALPYSLVSGDFNGDGNWDLAVANTGESGAPGSISILLGNGNGTFQKQLLFDVGAELHPHAIAVGDFNGDGKLDLATACSGASDSVSVLLGKGDGTFGSPMQFKAGQVPFGIAAGDFNLDGKTDLAVANGESTPAGSLSLLLGNGDGTFQPQLAFNGGNEPYSVVAVDLTGNGKLDLVAPNFFGDPYSVAVLLNESSARP